METTAVLAAPEVIRAFLEEYFDAWSGSDESRILAYYPDDVVLQVPMGTLEGKPAIRDNFVRPVLAGFPGNVHIIRNVVHDLNRVAVEWNLEASHTGTFANVEATGIRIQVPGCSVYEYNLRERTLTAGRIYFDLGTLMRQIGA